MLGVHQGTGIGVCQKTKKKKQKNCGHKRGPLLCLMTGYKNFLTIKFNPHLILRA